MSASSASVGHQLRSLWSSEYRRSFRSFRNLPAIDYRTVVDGGANKGNFTAAFLELHQPDRLVLVEALPGFVRELRNRFARHSAVSIADAALSDSSGECEFHVNTTRAASSLLNIDRRNSEWFGRKLQVANTIRVPMLSLPDLMQRYGLDTIDLLKLDLQGAERLVLTGAEPVLERVRVIYTEVFFEPLYAGSWLFFDLCSYLDARGFKLCGLSNMVHARGGDLLQANALFRQKSLFD